MLAFFYNRGEEFSVKINYNSETREQVYRWNFKDLKSVREAVFRYIKLLCNRKRLHSSLGNMLPVENRLKKRPLRPQGCAT